MRKINKMYYSFIICIFTFSLISCGKTKGEELIEETASIVESDESIDIKQGDIKDTSKEAKLDKVKKEKININVVGINTVCGYKNPEYIEVIPLGETTLDIKSKNGTVNENKTTNTDGALSVELAQGEYSIELTAKGYISRKIDINITNKTDFTFYMVNGLEIDKVIVLLEWSDIDKNLDLLIKSDEDILSEKHKRDVLGNKLWSKNNVCCEIARLNLNSLGEKQEIIVNNTDSVECTVSIFGNGDTDVETISFNSKDNKEAWKVANIQYCNISEINENVDNFESLPKEKIDEDEFISGKVTKWTTNDDGSHYTEIKSYYDGDKCVEEIEYLVEDDSVLERTTYEYNEVGGLARKTGYDKDNKVKYDTVYEYDKRFNLIKEENKINEQGMIYQYDEYGNVIEYYTYDKNEPYYYKYILEYNDKHLCSNISLYYKDDEEAMSYETFEYDSQGNCVIDKSLDNNYAWEYFFESTYDCQGNSICEFSSSYEYDYSIGQADYDILNEQKASANFSYLYNSYLTIYDN